MSDSYGHHHHHHGRDEDDYPPPAPPSFDDGRYPPPQQHPPPSYYGAGYDPPPPQVYHQSSGGAYPPPPQTADYHSQPNYPPPPSQNYAPPPYGYPPQQPHQAGHSTVVQHEHQPEHHFHPHMPSFLHHQHQQGSDLGAGKPTVRIYSKAETNYSLTIREGTVVLARSNPADPFQHWIKDERYSTKVKDEEGFPSFALVNKATGQAIKHSIGAKHPVRLIPYNPDVLDESVLWTESRDLGDGYRTVRMVNDIRLNVDAFNGDANHGGVKDGTTIVLWEWMKGENQRWKIVPY